MKKMILMVVLLLSTAISFAKQTPIQQVKDGVEVVKTLNKEVNSLKQNISQPTFKTDTTKPGFLSTTSNGIGTVYGDTKNGVSTVYNDVKSIAPEAKAAMKEIYNTIKDISIYSWNLLVRQQKIWSWCYLFGELLFFFAVFRFWKSYETYKTDKDETGSSKSVNVLPIIILGGSSLLLGYFSLIHFEVMMTGFFNPEFGALRNLIEIGKTLK